MAILGYLKNLLQLTLSPAHGWEEVSAQGAEPSRLASEGMYPLIGVASATVFISGCYCPTYEVGEMVQRAMVVFLSLFIAYWIGASLMDGYINSFTDTEVSPRRARTVTCYIISLLAVIQVIENLVPLDFAVIKFLPAFCVIVLWKATVYLSIKKNREGPYICFVIGVLILPWMLLSFVFNSLL